MHPEETQTQQETSDPLHHPATERPGEEVSREAVLIYSGEGRILRPAEAHRDSSQDLVSKPAGQDETSAGVRTGEAQIRLGSSDAPALWNSSISASRSPQCRLQSSLRLPGRLHAGGCRGPFLPLSQTSQPAQTGSFGKIVEN